jgi:hypothetical protein
MDRLQVLDAASLSHLKLQRYDTLLFDKSAA